jgi:hypothetical protein
MVLNGIADSRSPDSSPAGRQKKLLDSPANYATSLQPHALCLGRDRRAVWRNVAAPGGTIDRPVEEVLWMPDKKTTGSKKSGGKKSSGSKSK